MKTETVTLTPDVAKKWLEKNQMNRTIRESWVEYLANEMRSGNWKENGDTFRFDVLGNLMDGQHRCHAVIDAKFTYDALIVTELEEDARLTIDDTRLRRFSDDLQMNGQKNAIAQEALLRKIRQWETYGGFASKPGRVSRSQLARLYPEYAKEIRLSIEDGYRYYKAPVSQSMIQFMLWLLKRAAPAEMVEKFFSILSIGSQDADDLAVVRLRNKLVMLRENNKTPGVIKKDPLTPTTIYFMILGWNAWVTGNDRIAYQMPRGGLSDPYPAPVPVIKEGAKK